VKKARLDAVLAERGLFPSRTAAAGAVRAGEVRIGSDGPVALRPSQLVDPGAELLVDPGPRYASRGGIKLENALDALPIDVVGRDCIDVGASTGGFTDCLLQRGAAKVYAVDVGTNQLAWKLRDDPRVVSMERTNIRDITAAQIPEPIDLIVCDASFIGLRTALPAALALATAGAHLVALIKPQFEVGKGRVGKGGIVREPELHQEVCDMISRWLEEQPGWRVLGLTESPITGAEGNKEFLIAGHFGG